MTLMRSHELLILGQYVVRRSNAAPECPQQLLQETVEVRKLLAEIPLIPPTTPEARDSRQRHTQGKPKIDLSSADGDAENSGIEIVAGETIFVVDFDVEQNFVIQGDPDTPAGIQGVLFTPNLRAVVRGVAGSIAGTVASSNTDDPIEGLVVRATLTESR